MGYERIFKMKTTQETWYGIKDTENDVLIRDRGDSRPYMRKLKSTAERKIKDLCAECKNHNTSQFKIVLLHIQC